MQFTFVFYVDCLLNDIVGSDKMWFDIDELQVERARLKVKVITS